MHYSYSTNKYVKTIIYIVTQQIQKTLKYLGNDFTSSMYYNCFIKQINENFQDFPGIRRKN